MTNKILYWLTGFLPCRLITIRDKPYLERYYITRNIYLHRFISMDGDRHLHDHPWRAFSFILSGAYTEELTGGRYRARTWFNYIGKKVFHRIILVEPNTWTLFIRESRRGTWGFINSKGDYKKVKYDPIHFRILPIGRESNREPLK